MVYVCLEMEQNGPILVFGIVTTLFPAASGQRLLDDNFILVKTSSSLATIYQTPLNNSNRSLAMDVVNTTDSDAGMIYNYLTRNIIWAESTLVRSMSLDNRTVSLVADLGSVVTAVMSFALDPTNGNLYFTGMNFTTGIIGVMSSSGDVTVIFDQGNDVFDIVLHPENGLMFWIDDTGQSVMRGGMDGTNITTIHNDTAMSFGLAIDTEEDRIYWTDKALGQIFRSDLDGNNQTLIYEELETSFSDIKLLGDSIYFVNEDGLFVTRINKHNLSDISLSGPENGLELMVWLDVYSSSYKQQHIEPLCPVSIPNGKLHENCTSKVGDYCSDISCNYGYKKNENITQINCTESGTWNYNSSMLCREIVCPKDIPNGELSDSCGRKVGEACTIFTCNYGYERNEEPVFLNCTESGSWTNNLSLLCTEIRCPLTIPNGKFSKCCNGQLGETCSDYTCNPGFTRWCADDTLTCIFSGMWNRNTSLLCKASAEPNYEITVWIGGGLGILVLNLIVILIGVGLRLRRERRLRKELKEVILATPVGTDTGIEISPSMR